MRNMNSFVWRAGAIVGIWSLYASAMVGLILVPEWNALLFLSNLLAAVVLFVAAFAVTVVLLRFRSAQR